MTSTYKDELQLIKEELQKLRQHLKYFEQGMNNDHKRIMISLERIKKSM